jgi:predicted CopG family antitoxin
MHKKLTITVEEDVYRGLHRVVGRRRISQFIEELVRPHVTGSEPNEGYRQMGLDEEREREALAWSEATAEGPFDETR